MSMTSTYASVVISPATMHCPVVTSVSHATRALGSLARIASRIASEIWSATLSGWPIETDSLVNRCVLRRNWADTVVDSSQKGIRAPVRRTPFGAAGRAENRSGRTAASQDVPTSRYHRRHAAGRMEKRAKTGDRHAAPGGVAGVASVWRVTLDDPRRGAARRAAAGGGRRQRAHDRELRRHALLPRTGARARRRAPDGDRE